MSCLAAASDATLGMNVTCLAVLVRIRIVVLYVINRQYFPCWQKKNRIRKWRQQLDKKQILNQVRKYMEEYGL